jgi:formylglycine-generating enzyme required for sulfatase activity
MPARPLDRQPARPVFVLFALISVLPCLAWGCASTDATGRVPAPSVPEPTRSPFVESIPGTTVDIELLPVPDELLGRPLWVARTETTWDAYDAFVFKLDAPAEVPADLDAVVRPSHPYILADYGFGHAGFPVISVSHAGASAYCQWLSALTGRRYRLPTEAEFDALCAAAFPEHTSAALGVHAWTFESSDDQTHAVGSLVPDGLGLHDLLGNASEWCTAADGTPVSKGGAYLDRLDRVTCGNRRQPTPAWNMRDPQIPKSRWWLSDASFAGFRIVCEDEP